MNLSNRHLVLLAKIAIKAKRHIGLIKVRDMFTNPRYASNVLIRARLSDNQELADLTKEMSRAFNVIEVDAMGRYINTLKERNTNNGLVEDSKYFLIKFAHYLYGLHVDGASYRQAVETLLSNVETGEREFCINLAREFYPFWVNESRLAAETDNALNKPDNASMDVSSPDISDIWSNIEQEFLSNTEIQQLNEYAESLKQIGVLKMHIRTRQKIARIIIKELRNYSLAEENYRKAINNVQRLFRREDLTEFFLIVSREFHYFWAKNTFGQGEKAV